MSQCPRIAIPRSKIHKSRTQIVNNESATSRTYVPRRLIPLVVAIGVRLCLWFRFGLGLRFRLGCARSPLTEEVGRIREERVITFGA